MTKRALLLVIGILGISPADAKRAPHVWPQNGVETSIVFPEHGGIDNFEADGDDGIWIEDSRHRWYYGKFFSPCFELDYAEGIGFDAGSRSRFDKYSKIIARGEVCQLSSLVTADKPLPRKERRKLKRAERDAAKAAKRTPN